MNKYLILFVFSISILSSCSSDEEITDVRILSEGNWSGTYVGDDMGTWTMVISSNGSLTGELYSTNVEMAFTGTGNVTENGDIEAAIMVTSSTSVMMGRINGNNSSGTWVNEQGGISGTWSGSKD